MIPFSGACHASKPVYQVVIPLAHVHPRRGGPCLFAEIRKTCRRCFRRSGEDIALTTCIYREQKWYRNQHQYRKHDCDITWFRREGRRCSRVLRCTRGQGTLVGFAREDEKCVSLLLVAMRFLQTRLVLGHAHTRLCVRGRIAMSIAQLCFARLLTCPRNVLQCYQNPPKDHRSREKVHHARHPPHHHMVNRTKSSLYICA